MTSHYQNLHKDYTVFDAVDVRKDSGHGTCKYYLFFIILDT